MIIVLVAIGAFAVGFGGTGAYLAVSQTLSNQTGAGPDDGGTSSAPVVEETTEAPQRPCPAFTIEAGRQSGRPGELVEVRWVQGTRPNGLGGEAWICRDSDDTLYYQGHDIDGEPWIEGENVIVVGGGINGSVVQDGSAYVATVSFGQYRVSPTEFRLIGNNGTETVWIMS